MLPIALAAVATTGSCAHAPLWPPGVALPRGEAISENYRRQFELSLDLDGSAFACGPDHGRSDQCPTSLMLRDEEQRLVPVDADAVPYVVIPAAGPCDVAGEFTRRTGVDVGDFGVVLIGGLEVPGIGADTGPYNKLGEGSLALHRALGHEQCVTKDANGTCSRVDDGGQSITADVTTILFPGSAIPDLAPDNIAAITAREGARRWAALRASLVAGRCRSGASRQVRRCP